MGVRSRADLRALGAIIHLLGAPHLPNLASAPLASVPPTQMQKNPLGWGSCGQAGAVITQQKSRENKKKASSGLADAAKPHVPEFLKCKHDLVCGSSLEWSGSLPGSGANHLVSQLVPSAGARRRVCPHRPNI